MAQGRPYQAYQTTSIKTSSQKQLIVMLYDGMNRFTNQAIKAIHEKNFESAHNNLDKTGKILLELLSTLREDKGGEIAGNLKKIYVFCYEQIVIANLKKDVAKIREVQGVLKNLSEGWKQISQKSQIAAPSATPQKIRITG
jgi:flagellar protein FliS